MPPARLAPPSRWNFEELPVSEHAPPPGKGGQDLGTDEAEALRRGLVERVIRDAGPGIPVGDQAIPVQHEERVRLDLPRELRINRGLCLRDRLLELGKGPGLRPERVEETVVDELRVNLPFSEPESFDLAVMGKEGHTSVDFAAEGLRGLLLDSVLLGPVSAVGAD